MKTIEPKRGDTPTIRLQARDSNKTAVDISGYASASLKIAKSLNISNDDALYYISVLAANFTDGANGIHDFIISEDVTKLWPPGDYIYQTRLINSSNVVTSDDIGQLVIKQNLIDNEA